MTWWYHAFKYTIWHTKIIFYHSCKHYFGKNLTGIEALRVAPPLTALFWKFLGKTSFPNLWSLSLFHEISFLLTCNFWLEREKLYVSLNKLQAIRPQGRIAFPLIVASGLQSSVSFSLFLLFSCWSLRLFTYLQRKSTHHHMKLLQLYINLLQKQHKV